MFYKSLYYNFATRKQLNNYAHESILNLNRMGNIYILLFCIILCCVDYYIWQRKLAKSSTNGTEMVLQKMVKATQLLTYLTVSALIAFHFSVVSLTFSALALLSGVLSLFSCHKVGCSKDVIRIYAAMALILVGNVAMYYRSTLY